jgi:serine phosphatase RsbU (regulator of sigma subunit)/PAS domain-containing protein
MSGSSLLTPGQQEAALRAVFGSDVVGVAVGTGHVLEDANDEALRILGRHRAELEGGMAWPQVLGVGHPDRVASVAQGIERAGATVTLATVDRADGSQVTMLLVVAVTGRDPFTWLACMVDVSEQELLRQVATTDARIVATLLDDAPIGFGFIDTELRFVRVNAELAAMNGRPVAAHEGRRVFDVVPDLESIARPLLEGVLTTGRPVRDVELTGTTDADPGVVHTWLESFFPVRLPGGPVLGVAVIARDQTELHRLQDELDQRVREQHEALEILQRGLLPPVLPALDGVAMHAAYLPASDVVRLGGDWYDVVVTAGTRVGVVVGDAVGHGLEAVETMARTAGAVRAYLHEGVPAPEVLLRTNRLLRASAPDRAAAAAVAYVDVASGAVEYAAAGLPYPLLVDADGGALLREGRGPLLGVSDEAGYAAGHARLGAGATLVLYTDGLVERRRERMQAGLDRLVAAFPPGSRAPGPDEVVAAAVEACLAGQQPADDICALAITRS